MSELEFNAIFSKRLKYYLNKYDMTQSELAKRLGVSTQSVTNWCKGDKSPRMDKVDSMCSIFNWEKGKVIPKQAQLEMMCKIYDIPVDNIFLPIKSTLS